MGFDRVAYRNRMLSHLRRRHDCMVDLLHGKWAEHHRGHHQDEAENPEWYMLVYFEWQPHGEKTT
jgi:hypothetical protein